jgi:hypothetical protein
MESPERDETHVEQHGDGDVTINPPGQQPEPEPTEPEPTEDAGADDDSGE